MTSTTRIHPGVVYTLGRLVLFLLPALLLLSLGIDPLIAMMVALAVSMLLSWWVLRGPREAWAGRIEGRAGRRRAAREELDRRLAQSDAEELGPNG